VNAEQTCWTLVEAAGTGNPHARELFARVYLPVVRAYLRSRWGGGPRSAHVDDAVQETFVECFRENGALGKVERSPTDKFRTFLFGVVRNVALRFEERSAREHARRPSELAPLEAVPSGEERASRAFDRAWAEELLRRAAERQEAKARARGPEAVRRVNSSGCGSRRTCRSATSPRDGTSTRPISIANTPRRGTNSRRR